MRRSFLSLGIVAISLLIPGASRADEIGDRLLAALNAQKTPGASVAVVVNGAIVYSEALGLTAREEGQPVTAQTRFAIGSMGKRFTATMIMLLVGEGKLLSTAEDVARWPIGLSDESVISLELQEQMWKPEQKTGSYKEAFLPE